MNEQQVALVTGSSRGIGRAIATRLADDGFDVVVNYARSGQAAAEVVAQIEAKGRAAIAVGANIAEPADRGKLVNAAVERFGRIDVLVNNAGIAPPKRADILEASEESFDIVISTNLKGPYFLTQAVANRMIAWINEGRLSGGKIINIGSISSYTASVSRGDYCVSKAGMTMMTRLFAARLAEHNITVNEVSPGVIASDMTAAVTAKYDKLISEGLTPIRRWGEGDDVARAVSAIALDLFPFSTGARLDVDGGFHLKRL